MQKLTQNMAKIEQSVIVKSSNTNNNNEGSQNQNNIANKSNNTHNNTHNTLTYILEKKLDKDLPITLPVALTHDLKYESQSQRSRNQKIFEMLSKLNFFLHNHPDLKKEIVREFLVKNKIVGKEFYTDEKLDNLARYIRKGISIQPNKTMKDIIIEGTHFSADMLIKYQQEKEEEEEEQKNKDRDRKNKAKTKAIGLMPMGMSKREMKKASSGTNITSKSHLIYSSSSQLVYDMNEQKKVLLEPNPEDKPMMQPEDHMEYLREDIENLNKKVDTQDKALDRCAERLYYQQKFKHDEAHLKEVAKKKSKLLEFIVYENALARKQLNDDTKLLEQEEYD